NDLSLCIELLTFLTLAMLLRVYWNALLLCGVSQFLHSWANNKALGIAYWKRADADKNDKSVKDLAEGLKRTCRGAVDKTKPKEVMWKTVPHRLFFGRESTTTLGPGGVAFLNPEINNQEKTLKQFNDVQENVRTDTSYPFFDLNALHSIEYENNVSLEALKDGWYHNVVYLGKENDIPILTMTCTHAHVEGFKYGKITICAPAKEYADTLVRGLVQGKQHILRSSNLMTALKGADVCMVENVEKVQESETKKEDDDGVAEHVKNAGESSSSSCLLEKNEEKKAMNLQKMKKMQQANEFGEWVGGWDKGGF
ncbi:hypothetical protein M8C21_012129, partial [Ambrosia artemisiifolia]